MGKSRKKIFHHFFIILFILSLSIILTTLLHRPIFADNKNPRVKTRGIFVPLLYAKMPADFCNLIIAASSTPTETSGWYSRSWNKLEVFIGAAMTPPVDEIIAKFEKKYNVKVDVHYGGSGFLLSQMELTSRGDVYMPGSADFMEKAKVKKIVLPKTEKIVLYLIPAICVQKGNPKKIKDIKDLAALGLKIGIANVDSVCLGPIAVEIFEYNHVTDKVKSNIVTMAESCEKTAGLVLLEKVDAVIGWRDFQNWNPEKIQNVMLKNEQIPRISYAPIAIGKFCRNKKLAEKFLNFMLSKEAKSIFKKWGYILSEKEAKKYAPKAVIGGTYKLPAGW